MLKWITKRHDPKAAAITKEICVLSAEPQTAKKETKHRERILELHDRSKIHAAGIVSCV